jgi:hypothetical protein
MCVLSCSIYEQIDLVEFAHQPKFCFCNVRPLLLVKIIKKIVVENELSRK